jgi:hypothetical protein
MWRGGEREIADFSQMDLLALHIREHGPICSSAWSWRVTVSFTVSKKETKTPPAALLAEAVGIGWQRPGRNAMNDPLFRSLDSTGSKAG